MILFKDRVYGLGIPSIKMLRWMGLKLWLNLVRHSIEHWFAGNFFCRIGFHKPLPSGERHVINSKGLDLQTYYIYCSFCGLHFFPTKYQKEMYLRMKSREQDTWKNIVEGVKHAKNNANGS